MINDHWLLFAFEEYAAERFAYSPPALTKPALRCRNKIVGITERYFDEIISMRCHQMLLSDNVTRWLDVAQKPHELNRHFLARIETNAKPFGRYTVWQMLILVIGELNLIFTWHCMLWTNSWRSHCIVHFPSRYMGDRFCVHAAQCVRVRHDHESGLTFP